MKLKYLYYLIFTALIALQSCKKNDIVKPQQVVNDTTLSTAAIVLPDGTYTITSAVPSTKKAIGIKDASLSVGANVVQSDYHYINNEQKWKVVKYSNGYYKIYNVYADYALDIAGNVANSKVVLNKPSASDSQLWKIAYTRGVYGIVNKMTGYCLNLQNASTANGTFVTQDVIAYVASRGWIFKPVNGIEIDTVTTYSAAMKKDIKALVVVPSAYKTDSKKYSVLYLLHGHGGNHLDYSINAPQIRNYADKYGLIIVCADGNVNSWYLNALRNNPEAWQYETYISTELVGWVDARYRTNKTPKGRGIVGLSMGGHGALYNAFKHQDVFGACGSMSGCVDIVRVDTIGLKWQYNINDRLGPHSGTTAVNWNNNSVLYMTDLLKNTSLAINFDCDETDGFYHMNNDLHTKLTTLGIAHKYVHNHASIFYGHSWAYWNYKLPMQFQFMSSKLLTPQ
ncbi:MAG: hypothetical protein EOP47_12565 [Sphingobacteriaceae bacterium]|nr:MAG: hypothetical protein EOP47_12565 [Sphingobacteriaceae bacterium]